MRHVLHKIRSTVLDSDWIRGELPQLMCDTPSTNQSVNLHLQVCLVIIISALTEMLIFSLLDIYNEQLSFCLWGVSRSENDICPHLFFTLRHERRSTTSMVSSLQKSIYNTIFLAPCPRRLGLSNKSGNAGTSSLRALLRGTAQQIETPSSMSNSPFLLSRFFHHPPCSFPERVRGLKESQHISPPY